MLLYWFGSLFKKKKIWKVRNFQHYIESPSITSTTYKLDIKKYFCLGCNCSFPYISRTTASITAFIILVFVNVELLWKRNPKSSDKWACVKDSTKFQLIVGISIVAATIHVIILNLHFIEFITAISWITFFSKKKCMWVLTTINWNIFFCNYLNKHFVGTTYSNEWFIWIN